MRREDNFDSVHREPTARVVSVNVVDLYLLHVGALELYRSIFISYESGGASNGLCYTWVYSNILSPFSAVFFFCVRSFLVWSFCIRKFPFGNSIKHPIQFHFVIRACNKCFIRQLALGFRMAERTQQEMIQDQINRRIE